MAGDAPARKIRTALADDTPDVRELVRLILESDGGFEVVGEAGTGAAVVECCAAAAPDLVVLDLAMPEMDGLEAISRIRQVSPRTKIVVLSGFEASHAATEAVGLGASAYVPKGTRPAELVARLREVVSPGARPAPPRPPRRHRAEDDLIPMLTHELRNQIVVIEGFSEMILKRWDVMALDQKRDLIERVVRNARHMHGLVDAFSDVDRIGSDTLDVDPEPFDLGRLAHEVAEDLASLSETHTVEIDVQEDVVVPVDPVRVRQVVTNLLSNAAKFSPRGSKIIVTVTSGATRAEVTVEDEGPGIPADKRGELFQPFSRLGVTGTGGSGLGLYISRGIARAHGGDLELAPSRRGAAFVLSLPRP